VRSSVCVTSKTQAGLMVTTLGVTTAHDRGDDRDALLALPDHTAGFQPGVEAAYVACVWAGIENAVVVRF
jgi:hypothetical protein